MWFFFSSYASIGAIFNCYIFGVRMFTGTTKFTWKMFTWLFNVYGRWLYMSGFSIDQW